MIDGCLRAAGVDSVCVWRVGELKVGQGREIRIQGL